jgi:diguanylate cyclase (GGDEF)-like protein
VEETPKVQELAKSLRGCMKAAFPPILVQLIGEAIKDDPDFKTMARIIGMDPALTVTTLSLVNSPFYGLSTEVVDLERAAVVLGNKEILKLALSIAFQSRIKDQLKRCNQEVFDNWSMIVWSASAAQLLATRLCPEQANQAYLCTLIKDIPLLMLCSLHPEWIPEYPDDDILLCLHPKQLDMERKAWGIDHPSLCIELLKEWDVPTALCRAVAHHHEFHSLERYDAFTQAIILATKWSEVEYQAKTNPGVLVQFKSLLGMILGLRDEEMNRLRTQCIEQYKAFSRTLMASGSQFESDVCVNEIPLDDLQSLYLMSLDLQNVDGGLASVAELMGRHLKLSFSISDWELALLQPDHKSWTFFLFREGRIETTRKGIDKLSGVPWSNEGRALQLFSSGHPLGRIHVLEVDMDAGAGKGLSIYAQLISKSFDHYLRNHAVIERKARTLDLLPLGVARLDRWGTIIDANGELLSFFGPKGSVTGTDFWTVLTETKGVAEDPEWKRFIQESDKKRYNRIFCPLGPDSGWKDVCFYISAHKSEELEGGITVLVEDITEITDLQSEAIKQREYLENLLRSMQDLVLTVDGEGNIAFSSSPAVEQILGRNFFEICKPMGIFMEVWNQQILRTSKNPIQVSLQIGNEVRPLEIVITPLHSFDDSFMIVGRDLSAIIRLEEKIKRQAIYDHLTNIFNRHQFQVFLSRETERARRERSLLGVIFFDVDRLKEVNDLHGHAAGDEVLKELGRLLHKGFRKGMDYPCRYGGDEFVVLLTGLTSTAVLKTLGERLLQAAGIKFKDQVGLSVGLALLKEGESGDDLIRRADDACYQAKISGGNRIIWAK